MPWLRYALLTLLAVLSGIAGILLVGAEARAGDYNIAVVPQQTPTVTHRDWKPFADRLGRDTGHRIQVRVFRTFDEFETDLTNGQSELAYMNPYHQVVARKAQGYIPLVRDDTQKLAGVLVVAHNSPIRSVRDLNGKTIGFPDPNAFAATLYLRALLQEREHIKYTPRYLTSHGNVYRHVIVGSVDAGGGVNRTLSRERPETRAALRVLYETPGVASHPLSAHPRVPEQVREAITKAVLAMTRDQEGQALLKNVQLEKPMRANFERDYLPLEKLNIQRYSIATKLPTP